MIGKRVENTTSVKSGALNSVVAELVDFELSNSDGCKSFLTSFRYKEKSLTIMARCAAVMGQHYDR